MEMEMKIKIEIEIEIRIGIEIEIRRKQIVAVRLSFSTNESEWRTPLLPPTPPKVSSNNSHCLFYGFERRD